MTRVEDKFTDIQLQSVSEENGVFFVIAEALTEDFECETGLKALAQDSIRQAITWRHRHPIETEHKHNHIYGRAVKAWVDGSLFIKAELFEHTQDHKNYIEIIKERDFVNDPLGWSMHYRTYFNEKGVKYHWDVFEIAGTPIPACKECKTINFGVKKMEDEQKDKTEQELEDEKIAKAIKNIEELEGKLNAKTEAFEMLQTKLEKLEVDTKAKDKELEDKARSSKTLGDRLLELESTIKYLKDKKPTIDKILEVNPNMDEHELSWLKSMDSDYISKRLERDVKRAESSIQLQELEDSSNKAKDLKKKEDGKLEEVTLEYFTSQLSDNFKSE